MAVEIEATQYKFDDGSISSTIEWHIKGTKILHREDGPAMEYPNDIKGWYYHGKFIDCNSQEEFDRLIKLKAFW